MVCISPCLTPHPLKYVRLFLLATRMAKSNPDEMSLFPFLTHTHTHIVGNQVRKKNTKHLYIQTDNKCIFPEKTSWMIILSQDLWPNPINPQLIMMVYKSWGNKLLANMYWALIMCCHFKPLRAILYFNPLDSPMRYRPSTSPIL